MFTPPEEILNCSEHVWHGAAVMWHTSLDSEITNLKTKNTRFSSIRITIHECRFLAISVYFPTSGKDDEYLECNDELINFVTDVKKENEVILIGSDSNCSEKSSPRRRQALQKLCRELSLTQISTTHPSFHHHNGTSESNIDCFFISKTHASTLTNPDHVCTLDTPENLSSHDPISALLRLSGPLHGPPKSKYKHLYSKFPQQRHSWEPSKLHRYQHMTDIALTEYENLFPLPQHIPLKCELYSQLLVKSAEMSMDMKKVRKASKNKTRNSSPPSSILHQNWLRLRKAFRNWKHCGKVKDFQNVFYIQYCRARKAFQQRYRYETELKYINQNNKIMQADSGNKKSFYKTIRDMRRGNTTLTPKVLHTPAGTYHGLDTLEGFTADAELLAQEEGCSLVYNNEFYKTCILDNYYIFEFYGEDAIEIPEMTINDLNHIIDKDMKLGKASDIYRLTTEHLRYAGNKARHVLLRLLNDIINNIYYLTCPQVKKGLSTAVFKGKRKPLSSSSSFRRITMTPQIGCILDRFLDPLAENIFLQVQSPDQYGFTRGISYLLGAIVRGECQRYAIDTKKTCFGVSFDGKAAFPSVDRNIQIRELYSCGERGDMLQYSNNTYKNTVSQFKQDNMLGREFREYKGNRQGHKRAAGHFKSYINPCLVAANSSNLGFWIGPICVTCVCVADDTYALSGDPRQLQAVINIIAHYSKRYRVVFGADKTKVTITGSKQDIMYYKDINLWSLNGEPLEVSENNEHLGLIVSGLEEEIKNVDDNIASARKTIFSLLGNIFLYKCKLPPSVLLHVWSLYVSPVLRSGLNSLPIRPPVMKTLTRFHTKILRGILKFSPVSPLPPIYFLTGQLPIEAMIHRDLLTLFWNIWANPQTKAFEILKYLLMMSDSKSLTWAAHVRIIFQQYRLPNPLTLLSSQPWPKERWNAHIKTTITAYHESLWRKKAALNSKLTFLNTQATGLSGRPHSVLRGINTTQDVVFSRVHIKMLAGDYLCYANLDKDRATGPHCCLYFATSKECPPPEETLVHLLTRCRGTSDIRVKVTSELFNTLAKYFPTNDLLKYHHHDRLTQFILDPTSINLPITIRIPPDHPAMLPILQVCRKLCYSIHRDRNSKLQNIRPQIQ